MRLVLQAEASECGLACLAMVADHHGCRLQLRELRQQFQLSLKGAALPDLIRAARELGLRSRPLRLELEQLPRLKTPCVLHWNFNHFVVLAKADARRIWVYDPAFGRRRLGYAEASEHFTGVALELTPAPEFRPRKAAPGMSLRRLTGRITGLWRGLALLLLLSLALQVFVVAGPFFLQWVVDQVLVSADRDLLALLAIGFGLLLLLQVGIAVLRGWAVIHLSSHLGLQLIGGVFSHLLKLPLEFFEKRHLGDVVSRMGSVRSIQRTLTTSLIEALVDGLMAVVTLAMMVLYSGKLALVSLAAVGIYFVLRAVSFRVLRNGTEQQLAAAARQQTHLLETIRGLQSVKVAGVEQRRDSEYANLLNETVNRDVWLAAFNLGFANANAFVFGFERIGVICIGALLVLDSTFSVGMLVAYLAYKEQFAGRVGALIDKCVDLRMLRLHAERLSDIVLEPADDDGRSCAGHVPRDASIEVRGLSFRYADGEPWILDDLDFTIEDGEAVAIVGASGCGKSTLVKLLLGVLKPQRGHILVGGCEVQKTGVQNVRTLIGAVLQDDRLFAGSIADNIAFGEESFDLQRVQAAARIAAVHEEIAAMPMGYRSLIGDMGTTLSGGQQQRVLLARALYRRPRILFLDEATSHLDVRGERRVNEAVRSLRLTRVIVAHRPETIASADRVLLLRDGRIAREGRPRPRAALPPAANAKTAAA